MTGAEFKPNKGATMAWVRALDALKILEDQPDTPLAAHIAAAAAAHADRPALIASEESLSYAALAARINRYAHWGLAEALPPGATIALLMPNSPDYAAIWLGLTRIGCVVALLNTNLTGEALIHGIRAAGATHLIVAVSLLPAIREILSRLPVIHVLAHGKTDQFPDIAALIERFPDTEPHIPPFHQPRGNATALLIYTSGTTGLPKAATVPHRRLVEWSFWFAGMMDAQAEDRLYNCLPMYHSVGGVVAIGAMLVRGGAVVIRERFSASRFWDDIAAENCSIFQYIGELCRYLNNAPPSATPPQHRLRLACGNGLRGEVWESFQSRFKIPQILEFYAATEGSVSLYNCEGKPGAIGRVPAYLAHRFPVALIRIDADSNTPLRDLSGHCIPCIPGEAGEAIGRIPSDSLTNFYTDGAASEKKILRGVFADGDAWFRTGDLMRKDQAGYYYFLDRLGDTFRWKGENVATTEVAAVLAACPGIAQAVVYGVAIPGHDGRAGMATIVTTENFDITTLPARLTTLPDYARPLFIRLRPAIDITGTFKFKTADLAREGYNTSDPVWFHDRQTATMRPLDEALKSEITSGSLKL